VSEDAITVRLVGPLLQLQRLSSNERKARIDLSSAREGINTFDISADNFTFPQSFKLTQISPSAIKVEMDRVIDKVVRVKAVVEGEPAPGYRITEIVVDPPFLNLQGARNQLKGLQEVLTEEIDISGVRETVKLEVPLRVTDLSLKEGVKNKVTVIVMVRHE
jgi:hypothetical protein